ncbi:MAG: hypothetical protein CL797_07825 [Chromatiales bacterium]|nr:hypothetical protein [Chromatiales bacterium]
MWAFNVVRQLFLAAGFNLIPDEVPQHDHSMDLAVKTYLETGSKDTRCVVKVHTCLKVMPFLKVIRIRRDVRDRIFSFCRFTKTTFDEALINEMVATSFATDAYYDQWPTAGILNISFESIIDDSMAVIEEIAAFIGFMNIDGETLEMLDRQLSKQQVRQKIDDLNRRVFSSADTLRQNVEPQSETVNFGPGEVRAFDISTGFQSGHVSDYHRGDWKHLWSDEQKQMVDHAIRLAEKRLDIS